MAEKKAPHTDAQILLFIIALCLGCGILLAVTSYSLRVPQKTAKEFDRSKQMLIAAKILNHAGFFQILQDDGTIERAKWDSGKSILIPEPSAQKATEEQIKAIAEMRIRPLLTNKSGEVFTFEEKNITMTDYLAQGEKTPYAKMSNKLFYAILPNEADAIQITAEEIAKELHLASAFVIPVSGYGLWAPIYGYIAIAPNGNDVIGTTWYEQAETPGLGANISEAWWQEQFYGKEVFQGEKGVELQTAPMGIIVVKGEVKNVYRRSPLAESAVDGISGATLTGDGVTAAYRDSLTPYREFLIKLNTTLQQEK